MLSLEPDEASQMAIYNEILSETGAASALPRSSPARYVAIGATPEKARETADRQLSLLIERQTAMAAARGAAAPSAGREQRLARQFIAGTPEQCIEQIEALRARLGVSSLRCVFNGNGSLDNETAVAAMTLFAGEVLPVVSR